MDCGCNLDPEPCAVCARLPADFYDSEAQQLAAEIAYELFEFWQMRARREHQWRRLRTRHGVHIIKLCNPGNSIQTWDRVKGALRRRGCPKFQKV